MASIPMGDSYYYVTSTGTAFAGQGMSLHGATQSVAFPAPVQDGDLRFPSAFDGSGDDFDCGCTVINAETGNYGLQPLAFQVPYSESSSNGISDAELTDSDSDMVNSSGDLFQDFSASGNFERAGSPYNILQDEQNPGATWVEGPPQAAPFGDLSGSNSGEFNGAFCEPFDSEPAFDFTQHQTFNGAATQPESLQIPNRDQRAQRRAQLLAQMQQISQELIELEALDAA
ncbi:hypothetical protein KC332_g15853 [Hortaea werneckii]|nr:hypothetical protein KC358_g15952 [Hortaea werneckii]KAI6801325.1 hypothetical protein KC350_g15682 [Hortaea werneckii]KAI6902898.1 hypothetical protein KC348_g15889 [Hortaea werneckii]KAI6921777.1 hypothetical protein KC341_g15743 [Hortaea werneckii]KAI6955198.1 hypothetical protein KC321_g15906 [Hortaea werneckii]